MKTLKILIVAVGIGVIAILGFAYSGIYDVAASSSHSSVVTWLLSTTSHASVERQSKDVVVPELTDDLVLAGVNDFNGMCAGCHGAPGKEREAMGQGLNPPAPDLAKSAAHMDPAELFWVTKNGIKMTGMPAWGASHDDDSIWPVVAFLIKLPDIDVTQYEELIENAGGMGHHADDSVAEAHPHEESGHSEDALAKPEEHDHDSHEH